VALFSKSVPLGKKPYYIASLAQTGRIPSRAWSWMERTTSTGPRLEALKADASVILAAATYLRLFLKITSLVKLAINRCNELPAFRAYGIERRHHFFEIDLLPAGHGPDHCKQRIIRARGGEGWTNERYENNDVGPRYRNRRGSS